MKIGKSPLFEVRHMDADANISQKRTLAPEKKLLEGSKMTKSEEKSEVVESDEKHVDHSPSPSNPWSSDKPVSKRSSAVCVYTYKVNYLDFHPYYSFSIFFHYVLVSSQACTGIEKFSCLKRYLMSKHFGIY